VVGSLDPYLFFFFLFFLFFFFLSIGLLAAELSLGEEDETKEYLASEEGKEHLTGEEGEGST
jgi:SNF family Na+-dependent transporter